MRFHGVFLGAQHEMWSKQHNGKVRSLRRCLHSRHHGVSLGSWLHKRYQGEIEGSKPLIFMCFHEASSRSQHEIWSKQHNGKVRLILIFRANENRFSRITSRACDRSLAVSPSVRGGAFARHSTV